MDVPCEVQGNIHVCLALFNMCPVFWVHIKIRGGFLWWMLVYKKQIKIHTSVDSANRIR